MNIDLAIILQWLNHVKVWLMPGLLVSVLFGLGYIIGRTEQTVKIKRDLKKNVPEAYRERLENLENRLKEREKYIRSLEAERISLITYVNYLLVNLKVKK